MIYQKRNQWYVEVDGKKKKFPTEDAAIAYSLGNTGTIAVAKVDPEPEPEIVETFLEVEVDFEEDDLDFED